jgi:ssDNA-specific exonuclease RecJ
MAKVSFAFLFLLLFWQCGKQLSPEEAAMEAAQKCYQQLFAGDYDSFLAGRADADSLPAGYREQLLTCYKQFRTQQENAHGSMRSITANRAEADTLQKMIEVFLTLSFADSLKEEIVVPMISRDGEWKMK